MSSAPGPGARDPVVTIDGPAGSGKSSTAREVARRLGFRHLDSGALYRSLALGLIRAGRVPPEGEAPDTGALAGLDLEIRPEGVGFRILLGGEDTSGAIRSEDVTRLAARIAKFASVRNRLLPLQRTAARFGGLVADGRDMGTVVFPDASVKVFLTASLPERARRRLLQEGRPTDEGEVAGEAERIRERDRSDETRDVAPLRAAPGALQLDTTRLAFDEQVERIVRAAREGPSAGDPVA
jgi:cytidylate kinase